MFQLLTSFKVNLEFYLKQFFLVATYWLKHSSCSFRAFTLLNALRKSYQWPGKIIPKSLKFEVFLIHLRKKIFKKFFEMRLKCAARSSRAFPIIVPLIIVTVKSKRIKKFVGERCEGNCHKLHLLKSYTKFFFSFSFLACPATMKIIKLITTKSMLNREERVLQLSVTSCV